MYSFQHHAKFFTATNLSWLPILENDYHKQILLEALKQRVNKNEVTIYAFVIMREASSRKNINSAVQNL
jgi:hypothetical protein